MIKKISLASSLRSSGKDPGKIVKYTPCSTKQLDDDLDEVAVISNATPENVKYGTGSLSTANGPRVVPGIITSSGAERSRLVTTSTSGVSIVQREYRALSTTSPRPSLVQTLASTSTGLTSARPYDGQQHLKVKCASKQSLIETVTSKLQQPSGGSTIGISTILGNGSGTDTKKKSHGSVTGFINRGHVSSDLEIPRKTREQRKKEIKKEFERWETSTAGSDRTGCNWSFVFDPSGRLCYYWSMVVSVAFLYNFWTIIYRVAFQEINESTMSMWFSLDYFADLIYILDIAVNFRTGYLEEGVLQTDPFKLRSHYMNCTLFYIDCLCLLPLDFLYLSIGFNSILRCFRLVKIYRFWAFLDRTERHTNYPNVFRTVSLVHYILVIFHWNACLLHIILTNDGFGSRDWFKVDPENCRGVLCNYLHTFYWSALSLTLLGDLPRPRTRAEYFFLDVEIVFGLFLFAAVLGHVANIVTNVSAARKEFQAKLDAVKTYMRMRRVPDHLQNKVIRWFDYLWMTQKSSDEERSVGCLPDKLKAEIAIHVHLDTLKRVEIFQNTEAGFLCELVLRLRPVLFSPGDYICRKGEVGKEMYIVNRGRLQVVTDNGKTVLATLRAGSYFGEISILNMGTAGNRRTASVRSVGYSDLFCLNKQDMWDVLKDYPAARVRLEAIAVKRLEKYRKEPLKKIAMGRSRSTPGLVESRGKVPISETKVTKKEPTSASTATLLTDDELDKYDNKSGDKHESQETRSNASEESDRNDLQNTQRTNHESCISHHSASGRSTLTTMPSQLIYPTPVYPANYTPVVTFDRRSPQPHQMLTPSAQTFPYFSPSPDRQALPTYCTISPAASSTHLSVPQPISYHTTSPVLSEHHIQMPSALESAQDPALLAEIQRLRERLITLETENASMTIKLNQQQWEVENRLAEIEMQISGSAGSGTVCGTVCGTAATGSTCSNASSGSGDDNEKNKESII